MYKHKFLILCQYKKAGRITKSPAKGNSYQDGPFFLSLLCGHMNVGESEWLTFFMVLIIPIP